MKCEWRNDMWSNDNSVWYNVKKAWRKSSEEYGLMTNIWNEICDRRKWQKALLWSLKEEMIHVWYMLLMKYIDSENQIWYRIMKKGRSLSLKKTIDVTEEWLLKIIVVMACIMYILKYWRSQWTMKRMTKETILISRMVLMMKQYYEEYD